MQIHSEQIDEKLVKKGMVESRPFARMSKGDGCGLGNCNCSPGYWITLSDGNMFIRAQFNSKDEFEQFEQTGELLA